MSPLYKEGGEVHKMANTLLLLQGVHIKRYLLSKRPPVLTERLIAVLLAVISW